MLSGLEKVVVFEDHVVVVMDKSICDSGCGGECTDDYDQSFTNGKWNNIHHDFTMYPMTALD